MSDEINKEVTETREFTENPFDHQNRRPEDVVRLFYLHDVPIIPVISKRGILIGILRKESVISELSDIERVEKLKIDEFITRLAVKMNFDDLLQYGKIREFVVINIFGELQGRWNRLQLFAACDNAKIAHHEDEIKKQQEDQVLEWMIYHILEHIPRALYALNEKGKTVFYNSLFEELYEEKMNSEIDVENVEKTISDPVKNELFSGLNQDDLHFYNSDLDIFYEKIPMASSGKKSYGPSTLSISPVRDSPTTTAGRYTRYRSPGVERTSCSASNLVWWYGVGNPWPMSKSSSVNSPW